MPMTLSYTTRINSYDLLSHFGHHAFLGGKRYIDCSSYHDVLERHLRSVFNQSLIFAYCGCHRNGLGIDDTTLSDARTRSLPLG